MIDLETMELLVKDGDNGRGLLLTHREAKAFIKELRAARALLLSTYRQFLALTERDLAKIRLARVRARIAHDAAISDITVNMPSEDFRRKVNKKIPHGDIALAPQNLVLGVAPCFLVKRPLRKRGGFYAGTIADWRDGYNWDWGHLPQG